MKQQADSYIYPDMLIASTYKVSYVQNIDCESVYENEKERESTLTFIHLNIL